MSDLSKYHTLDSIASRASLFAIVATMSLVVIFTSIAVIRDRHAQYDSELRRLSSIGNTLARSISAEILLGDSKSVDILTSELAREYELAELKIVNPPLPFSRKTWWSSLIPSLEVQRVEKLPGISPDRYLIIQSLRSVKSPLSGWLALLLVCIPLTLFGIFTTLKIQRELHRSIIDPIQRLAHNPETWSAEGPWVAREAISLHERFRDYIQQRDAERDNAEQLKIEASIGQMAAQVAHDIRSPLAALDMVSGLLTNIPEQKRVIIRSALSRIRDIANGLLTRNRMTTDKRSSEPQHGKIAEAAAAELLSSLIDSLITEKRIQYRSKWGIEIEAPLSIASYGLFGDVEPTEFKRALSNLIDNGVEAVGNKGRVWVELDADEKNVVVSIKDTGRGVPKSIISKLSQRGQTHGKPGGTGLGLYSARTLAESWGGSLQIFSKEKVGTTVLLTLPRATPPNWFVPIILIRPNSKVVILDDDSSIHQIWQGRFDSLRPSENGIEIVHLSNGDDLRNWHGDEDSENTLYLIDYELIGSNETGLELITQLNIYSRSFLVTSRFEERSIRNTCASIGVKVIPKGLAGFIPIRIGTLEDPPVQRTFPVDAVNPQPTLI